MVNPDDILSKVSANVIAFLRRELSDELHFHNIHHTLEVVRAVTEIGINENLSAAELEPVKIAAWFHDTGYFNKYIGHEDESIKLAEEFLRDHSYPADKMSIVISCIEATKYPQAPLNLLEEVLCDADLYHFSRTDYVEHEQNLRREWGVYFNKLYSDEEWARDNCQLLVSHRYFTSYGKKVLQRRKEQNIAMMQCRF
ncbi:MAG TPA: hypothetical protein DIT07_16135 [Sphingobacteriaceae bacterium]|nr:hypothetical protein [Sphingobacteriaceae bacterium]